MRPDIYVSNPGNNRLSKITPKSFDIDFSLQEDSLECRTMNLDVDRRTPIKQFATVVAIQNKVPIFRGYVESYEIGSDKSKSLEIKGMENLLNCRYAMPYFYPADEIDLDELLSDALTDKAQPGLLACANSALPPGLPVTVHDAATNIIAIDDGGTSSRLGSGDIYYIDYQGLFKLRSWPESVDDLDGWDKCYFRDATDLYIRIDDSGARDWYNLGGLLVENAFDTTIRLGDCPEDIALDGSLETDFDPIGDLIVPLVVGHEYEIKFRDDWAFTYIDIEEP